MSTALPSTSWKSNPGSKSEQLALHIQQLIEARTLNDGARIGTKSDLVLEHGVAAGTLNEALRLLQSRGYVVVKPGPQGGVFVADRSLHTRLRHSVIDAVSDPRYLRNCMEVREELETLVTLEAASACTPQDAQRLKAALHIVETTQEPNLSLRSIWDLHRIIASIGSNSVLTTTYISLMDMIEDATVGQAIDDSVPTGVNPDTLAVHQELVRAVITNDLAAAARAAKDHTPFEPRFSVSD